MANNFIQPGDVIDFTPSGASYSSGDVVVIGSVAGVALVDIADGVEGSAQVTGVFNLPKATGGGSAITQGAVVYWDGSVVTTDDGTGANARLGYAFRAAGDGDAAIHVKLMH